MPLRQQLHVVASLMALLHPTLAYAAGSTTSTLVNAHNIVHAVRQLPGDATIDAALRSVRVFNLPSADPDLKSPSKDDDVAGPENKRSAAKFALATLGFRTALDMRLLGGGPEAQELMAELRVNGRLSIADRSKIRLLVGDSEHLARFDAASSRLGDADEHLARFDAASSRLGDADEHLARFDAASSRLGDADEHLGRFDAASSRLGDADEHLGRFDAASSRLGETDPQAQAASFHTEHDILPARAAHRQMQDGSGVGLTTDGIAIMLSVLVGVAGYIIQANTARRAERVAANQQHELLLSEQKRQREHEQMIAQIARTDRWLDDCCRPIEQSLQSMMWARAGHVERAIFELETNKPDVATDLLASASRATTYEINEEGAVIGRGMIRWLPRSGTVFTDAYKGNTFCAQTAVGMICSLCDSLSCMQAPYCAEIPRAILEIVGAEPDDTIAVSYRRYMNTVCGPEVQRVAQILQDFSPTMQWPPMEWLQEKFPGVSWHLVPANTFCNQWLSYARRLEVLLDMWQQGDFSSWETHDRFPYAGLSATIAWSKACGERKQSELIGMTTAVEVDVVAWTTRAAEAAGLAQGGEAAW